MRIPLDTKYPIDRELFQVIGTRCISMIEKSPEAKELYARWEVLLAQLEGKVDDKQFHDFSDLFMNACCQYGYEAFRMGLILGLDPMNAYTLPDGDNE